MSKPILLLILSFFCFFSLSAQDCDCSSHFNWVKETFEQNDAGFEYVLNQKGKQAYDDHTERMRRKIESVKTLQECTPLLYEWLTFFRKGHIAIRLKNQNNVEQEKSDFSDWETYPVKLEEFKNYLDKDRTSDYEGIWISEPYTIGIRKEGAGYVGFIVESGTETWTKDQVKLKFSFSEKEVSGTIYMRDHSAAPIDHAELTGKNHLQLGFFSLTRQYPILKDEPKFEQHFKAIQANKPYLDQLDKSTLYLRIPSFDLSQKSLIDSVLHSNRKQITETKNLIIDIRYNGGGSDNSYSSLIEYLYTNPIRKVGMEFLSTPLNNQRMLDLIQKPESGFSEAMKEWFQKAYDKLQKHPGQFVNLDKEVVTLDERMKTHTFPENIGIIINQRCGSTTEQFLLEAKQSKKVKLFGVTTYGSLDLSNIYFVDAPCGEFQLGYSLSRSMRIPDFTIDGKGIQPDIYLDKSIPEYEWIPYVKDTMMEW